MIKLTVENLYGGGAVERFHTELEKVIANIVDPNTPAKKPRKVKLEMVIKPNEQRNMAEVLVTTACTLQSPEPLETSIYIGADPRTGEIGAQEMTPGENSEQHIFSGTMEKGKILKLNKGVANA